MRTEDPEGVWDFAAGCMRTYLILKEKARQFEQNAEIRELVAGLKGEESDLWNEQIPYSSENARRILNTDWDRRALANRPLACERIDQLTVELLLGV